MRLPAKMGTLCGIAVKGFVVEFSGSDRIEANVELIIPTERETGLRESIVAILGPRISLGKIGGVTVNRNDKVFNVSVLTVNAILLLYLAV